MLIIKSNIDHWQAKKLTGTEWPQKRGVPWIGISFFEHGYEYDAGQLNFGDTPQ